MGRWSGLLFLLCCTSLANCGRDAPFADLVSESRRLEITPSALSLYEGGHFRVEVALIEPGRRTSVIGEPDLSLRSSDEAVASVSSQGEVVAGKSGEASIIARYGDLRAETTVSVHPGLPVSLEVSPSPVVLSAGGIAQLTVRAVLPDGEKIDVTNPSTGTQYRAAGDAATVDPTGRVLGLTPGTAIIEVVHGAISTFVDVLVVSDDARLESIWLVPDAFSLAFGEGMQLSVRGTLSDGTELDVLNAGNFEVSFASGAEEIATVSATGFVTAQYNAGVAEIVAKVGDLSASAKVEVHPPEQIVGLFVSPEALSLLPGEIVPYQATALFADGRRQDVTLQAAVQATDPSVISVSPGQIVARRDGFSEVIVRYAGFEARIQVYVDGSAAVVELFVEPSPVRMRTGEAAFYTVYGLLQNGRIVDLTQDPDLEIIVYNQQIARDVGRGQLFGVTAGQTGFVAEYLPSGISVVTDIFVEPFTNDEIVEIFLFIQPNMVVGDITSYQVLGRRADGNYVDLTSDPSLIVTSDNPAIVSIGPGDTAMALSPGSTWITADYLGLTATVLVRVDPIVDPVVALDWVPAQITMTEGQTASAWLRATLASGAVVNVTFDPRVSGNVFGPISIGPSMGTTVQILALGPGMAGIQATFEGFSATLNIFISGTTTLIGIELQLPQQIGVGEGAPFSVIARYSDGSATDITFDPGLALRATPMGIVSLQMGFVFGLNPGLATVGARFNGFVDTATILVVDAPIIELFWQPPQLSLQVGQFAQAQLMGRRASGMIEDLTNNPQTSFTQSGPIDVFFAPNGLTIEGLAPGGMASVTGSHAGLLAVLPVNVVPPAQLIGIRAEPNPMQLSLGSTQQIRVVGLYSDGREVSLSGATFQSSATNIVTVSSVGVARGLAPGNTTITVSYAGFLDVVDVSVSGVVLTGIRIEPNVVSIELMQSAQLVVIGQYNDGSESPISSGVSWTSFDPSVADVDSNGVVTGLSEGSTVVLADVGGFSSAAFISVFTGMVPTLSAIDPDAILAGSPPTLFTVFGSGFAPGDQIFVGGSVLSTTFISPSELSTTLPGPLLADVRALDVRVVRISNGFVSDALSLVVTTAPVVDSYAPTAVFEGASVVVTVTGSGLLGLSVTSMDLSIGSVAAAPDGSSVSFTVSAGQNTAGQLANIDLSNAFGSANITLSIESADNQPSLMVLPGEVVQLSGTNVFSDVTVLTGGTILGVGLEPLALLASGNITVRGVIDVNGKAGAQGFQIAARGGDAGPGGGGGGGAGDGDTVRGAPGGAGAPEGQPGEAGQGPGTPAGAGGGVGSGEGAAFGCGEGGGGGALGGDGGSGGGDFGPGGGGAGGFAFGAGSNFSAGTGGGGGTTCGPNSGGGGGGGGGRLVLQVAFGGEILIEGNLRANGGRGGDGFGGTGGGGGGSGGRIELWAPGGLVTVNDVVSARGGDGGNADFGDTGGGGGGGIVAIDATPGGTVNAGLGLFDVAGGLRGTSLGGGNEGRSGTTGAIQISP